MENLEDLRERVDCQVGETGIGAGDWRKRSGHKTDLTHMVVGVFRSTYKNTVDEKRKIPIINNHEQRIGRGTGSNSRCTGRGNQGGVVTAPVGIVTAKEKFTLAGDLKIVKLVAALAVNNACIAPTQKREIHLNATVAHGKFCIRAWLEKISLVDQHVVCSILESAGLTIIVPRTVDITAQAIGERGSLTCHRGSSRAKIRCRAGIGGRAGRQCGRSSGAAPCRCRCFTVRGVIIICMTGNGIEDHARENDE